MVDTAGSQLRTALEAKSRRRRGRPHAVRFHGGLVEPLARAATAQALASKYGVGLHLDHVTDMNLLRQAAAAGFSSAMFDAGHLSYADNVARTVEAVQWAHANGLWLEAELGSVGGKPDAPASAHAAGVRTEMTWVVRHLPHTISDSPAADLPG